MRGGAHLLSELTRDLPATRAGAWSDVWITGIAIDSREVRPGALFVAMEGSQDDGHRHIPEAIARGAAAVVLGKAGAASVLAVPAILVPDPRAALAELARRFYGDPSRDLRVIGVTGTNAKTTVTCMVHSILAAAGARCGLIGTVSVKTGCRTYPARLTTPEAHETLAVMAELRAAGGDHVVMEVSSQGVVMRRVAGIDFDVGVLTNLSPDHLDVHASLDEYFGAKRAFLKMLPEDGVAVLNRDDPGVCALGQDLASRTLWFATHGAADLVARRVRTSMAGLDVCVEVHHPFWRLDGGLVEPGAFPVYVPVLGSHNVSNVAAACLVALLAGAPVRSIQEGLSSYPGVERRMQVTQLGDLLIIDDTALNPASYDAVFAAVAELGMERVVVVNAVRGSRGAEINRQNAAALARGHRLLGFAAVISTASRSHVTAGDAVSPAEEAAFLGEARRAELDVVHFPELEDAIGEGLRRTAGRGVLLLLGAQGMDAGAAVARKLLQRAAARRVTA